MQEILSGTTITAQSDNRIVFESDTHKMIVSRMKGSQPTDNWLLTAYEKKEKPVSASSSDIETEPEGKRNGTATPQNGALSGGKDTNISETDKEKVASAIESAESEVNINPTEGQKEAGNYKKGHLKLDGYDITIEQPKGSIRRGTDDNGKQWEQEMHNTYGYIRGTEGVDGDHIDVFLSDDPTSGGVYVVDQVNPKTGEFDEHKVMYGFPNIESAKAAYLSNYEEGWQGLGAITPVSKEEFKKRIDSSHRKTKPFSKYKSANPIVRDSKGNVVPLSKRFDLGGSRYLAKQKGDGAAVEASPAQRAVQRMLDRILGRIFGNDYKMDAEEGQRTLDMFRELARLMGGPKRKTTSETAKLNSPEGEKAYVTVVSDAESGAKVRKNLDTLEKNMKKKVRVRVHC